MTLRELRYDIDDAIEEGFGSREMEDGFSIFDHFNKGNEMKTVWIVECGSLYSSDPWEIEGVFATEELADKYIAKSKFPNLLHKSEWELKEGLV